MRALGLQKEFRAICHFGLCEAYRAKWSGLNGWYEFNNAELIFNCLRGAMPAIMHTGRFTVCEDEIFYFSPFFLALLSILFIASRKPAFQFLHIHIAPAAPPRKSHGLSLEAKPLNPLHGLRDCPYS
jgi:hypothetical protein